MSKNRVNDATPDPLAQQFVQFAVACGVLCFGSFQTKAGRTSPYFLDAGRFCDGVMLGRLAQFYAQRLLACPPEFEFDMIFGPAYKGIPLAATLAVELARLGRNVPLAYNRKESKDHGEGGSLVGAPLQGRVLIIDDVMSAGTAVRQSIDLIQKAGATPHALIVALDRQEKAAADGHDLNISAVSYARRQWGLQVCAIATLDDLVQYLALQPDQEDACQRIRAYRDCYGVTD